MVGAIWRSKVAKIFILFGSRINVFILYNCFNDDFIDDTFTYAAIGNETYDRIVTNYVNLTNF